MITSTDAFVSLRVITEYGDFVSETHYPSEQAAWEEFTLAEVELQPGHVLQLIYDDRVLAEIIEDTDGPPF